MIVMKKIQKETISEQERCPNTSSLRSNMIPIKRYFSKNSIWLPMKDLNLELLEVVHKTIFRHLIKKDFRLYQCLTSKNLNLRHAKDHQLQLNSNKNHSSYKLRGEDLKRKISLWKN